MRRLWQAAAALVLAAGVRDAQAQLARVRGRVTDYVAQQPLSGALVQLAQRGGTRVYAAQTDSTGAFTIDSVVPGSYFAGFFHSSLEDLGVHMPLVTVDVKAPETIVPLATPNAASVLAATCPAKLLPDSTGLLIGRVVDAETDAPIAGATVNISWFDVIVDKSGLHQERRAATTKSNADGLYGVCGIPTDGSVSLVASVDSAATGTLEVAVPKSRVLRQRFAISRASTRVASDSTTVGTLMRGNARARGVVTGAEGKAIRGASVSVRGSGVAAVTDAQGTYALANLPSGTQTLDVRAIGYSPQTIPVRLRSGDESRVDVALDTRVPMLEAVKVFGNAPDMNAFAERKRRGIGRFLTQENIRNRDAIDFTSLFYGMPMMRVLQSPTGHVLRYMSGISLTGGMGCTPTLFLNGTRMLADEDVDLLVDPRAITGIEVYGPHEQPAQFFSLSNCATIVVWMGMTPK